MLAGAGVTKKYVSVMTAWNAACFGLSSRTALTKQDKLRTDKIASVFKRERKKKKKLPDFLKAVFITAQLAN